SRSVNPPHTPKAAFEDSASARHSIRTGHEKHNSRTFRWAAPRTNRTSGSAPAHAARDAHVWSPLTLTRTSSPGPGPIPGSVVSYSATLGVAPSPGKGRDPDVTKP